MPFAFLASLFGGGSAGAAAGAAEGTAAGGAAAGAQAGAAAAANAGAGLGGTLAGGAAGGISGGLSGLFSNAPAAAPAAVNVSGIGMMSPQTFSAAQSAAAGQGVLMTPGYASQAAQPAFGQSLLKGLENQQSRSSDQPPPLPPEGSPAMNLPPRRPISVASVFTRRRTGY